MTLKPVDPSTYANYCQQVTEFAEWMVEYIHKTPIRGITGWPEHFASYSWLSEKSWKDGVAARCDHHKTLVASIGNGQNLVNISNRILKWGGIKSLYSSQDVDGIRRGFAVLMNENNTKFFATYKDCVCFTPKSPRIASHSKLYEMFEPQKWTIYDARVAAALACLVHEFGYTAQYTSESAAVPHPT